MIFGSMRMIMIGVMVAGLAGAGAYVFKLRVISTNNLNCYALF